MADEPQYDTLQLVGLHEPDYSLEDNGAGGLNRVELPGFYKVGFVKDGVFRPLTVFKAAGLFADIQRAQQAQQQQAQQQAQQQQAQQQAQQLAQQQQAQQQAQQPAPAQPTQ